MLAQASAITGGGVMQSPVASISIPGGILSWTPRILGHTSIITGPTCTLSIDCAEAGITCTTKQTAIKRNTAMLTGVTFVLFMFVSLRVIRAFFTIAIMLMDNNDVLRGDSMYTRR